MPVISTKHIAHWEYERRGPDRLLFRPGPEGFVSSLKITGLAIALSILLFITGVRGGTPWFVLHALLWCLAISWPLSNFYQRLDFIKDKERGQVRVRGQSLIFPYRRKFPLQESELVLSRRDIHLTTGATVHSIVVEYHWTLLVADRSADTYLSLCIGSSRPSEGDEPPVRVKRILEIFSDIFEAPVQFARSD